MAVKQEIEVTIRPDGSVNFAVKCAPGPSCLELTRSLEESLGDVVERERTPEFYQEVLENENIRLGSR